MLFSLGPSSIQDLSGALVPASQTPRICMINHLFQDQDQKIFDNCISDMAGGPGHTCIQAIGSCRCITSPVDDVHSGRHVGLTTIDDDVGSGWRICQNSSHDYKR